MLSHIFVIRLSSKNQVEERYPIVKRALFPLSLSSTSFSKSLDVKGQEAEIVSRRARNKHKTSEGSDSMVPWGFYHIYPSILIPLDSPHLGAQEDMVTKKGAFFFHTHFFHQCPQAKTIRTAWTACLSCSNSLSSPEPLPLLLTAILVTGEALRQESLQHFTGYSA